MIAPHLNRRVRLPSRHALAILVLGVVLGAPQLSAQQAPPPTAEAAPVEEEMEVPPSKPSILVLDVNLVDIPPGIDKILIGPISTEVASDEGLMVLTGQDVRRLTELEANRINAGCDEESCASEIADALGADLVIFSALGRLGTSYIFNMTLIDTSSATPLGRISADADDVSDLRNVVVKATRELMVSFRRNTRRPDAQALTDAVRDDLERAAEDEREPAPNDGERAQPSGPPAWASPVYIGATVTAAAGLFGIGGGIDLFSPTSRNKTFDVVDFVGPALMLSGLGLAVVPFVFNPFLEEEGTADLDPANAPPRPESVSGLGVSP